MSDLLAAVEQEIAELEEALRADPRQQKLKALRELKTLYQATDASNDVSAAAKVVFTHGRTKTVIVRQRVRPERKQLLDEVEKVLDMFSPDPVKTSDIFGMLSDEVAATIGGADPRNNLSAIIHNSGRFQTHGRLGWSLKTDPPPAEEEAV